MAGKKGSGKPRVQIDRTVRQFYFMVKMSGPLVQAYDISTDKPETYIELGFGTPHQMGVAIGQHLVGLYESGKTIVGGEATADDGAAKK